MTDVRTFARRFGVGILAVPALIVAAGPALGDPADNRARFDDNLVTVAPDCVGTASAVAGMAPAADVEAQQEPSAADVRVVLRFVAENQDVSCAAPVTATWRNLDTGETGSRDLTIASAAAAQVADEDTAFAAIGEQRDDAEPADPADVDQADVAGYRYVDFNSGAGRVEVTVSTNPVPERVEVTV
ncbi:hypothetical protein [Nocardia callitridis]|uniref:Secreted protein n=1 Tax=Nocardia callitridis TaxID=648753 RepID=A0ABP9KUW2_9NOCA